jgi:hypothetical protein
MSEATMAKGPRWRCRRCGQDVFTGGQPYEYRLGLADEADGGEDSVLRLCQPCSEDFVDEDERDAYLERLVAA